MSRAHRTKRIELLLAVLVLGCSGAQPEPLPAQPRRELAEPNAQPAHLAADWPFVDREAFAASLRRLAADVIHSKNCFSLWKGWSSRLGFGFQAPWDLWTDRPGPTVGWDTVVSPLVGEDGWSVVRFHRLEHDPRFDVTLSSHVARVIFLGANGISESVPPASGLGDTVVMVAPGNGRLVLIDMRHNGLVDVLPYAFDDEHDVQQAQWTGGAWVFRDAEAFVVRLKSLADAMAASSTNASILQVWADAMREHGIAVHGLSPTESPGVVELGHGFKISAEDVSTDGWTVRRSRSTAEAASSGEEAVRILARTPLVLLLRDEGVTSSLDPSRVNGSVLLVSTTDGRLIAVEMEPHGLVSVLPQAFD